MVTMTNHEMTGAAPLLRSNDPLEGRQLGLALKDAALARYEGESWLVRARAAAIQQKTSSEELDGLKRLNRILGRDQPLRDNVPRGYYLNIQI